VRGWSLAPRAPDARRKALRAAGGGEQVAELLEKQEERAVRHEQRITDDRGDDALDGREDVRVGGGEDDDHRTERRRHRLEHDRRPAEHAGRRAEGEDEREHGRVAGEREEQASVEARRDRHRHQCECERAHHEHVPACDHRTEDERERDELAHGRYPVQPRLPERRRRVDPADVH
jgi:hypothetical protein